MFSAEVVRIGFFVLACAILALFVFFPNALHAVYIDADIQCPPGGKVGQPCKDTTHGYTTKGKCAYVYVCKATSVDSKTPPPCKAGSADCPKGSPVPPSPTPYARPVKIASGSPVIPRSSISEMERGILDAAFSEGGEHTTVDLESLSDSANLALKEILAAEGGGGEDALSFTPESFDKQTSTLFSHLREGAVTLAPGQSARSGGGISGSISERLAYASGGFFGGAPMYGGGSSESEHAARGAILVQDLWSMPRFLAMAVAHAVKSIGLILLADFSAAKMEWIAARADMAAALSHAKEALVALWQMVGYFLLIMLKRLSDAI